MFHSLGGEHEKATSVVRHGREDSEPSKIRGLCGFKSCVPRTAYAIGFLQHSLMVSRMHFMLEMACRTSGGLVDLASWSQGSQLAGNKVELPRSDRADRGTMVMADMLKKLSAYYHLIKKQQKHRETFGVHPIRAVLIETPGEARAQKFMKLVQHPLVCGTAKRGGIVLAHNLSPLHGAGTPTERCTWPAFCPLSG